MPSILSWDATIYDNESKSWKSGRLVLYNKGLSFQLKNEKLLEKTTISFYDVTSIKRGTSRLVYKSIILRVQDCNVWLSSFKDRNYVFCTLVHFWQAMLTRYGQSKQKKISTQEQNLLLLAHNTQDHLIHTTTTLHNQGKQIANAKHAMCNIHNDLTVASRLTGDLDSWLGAWRINKGRFKKEKFDVGRGHSAVKIEDLRFDVLTASVAQESHSVGELLFMEAKLEIRDAKAKVLFSSAVCEITEITVHSPWDASIVRSVFGQSETKLHLISSSMQDILEILQSSYSYKITCDEPPTSIHDEEEEMQLERNATNFEKMLLLACTIDDGVCISQNSQQTDLTEHATRELSSVLSNLKTLALDVGLEQDAQLKDLDSLDNSLFKEGERLKKNDLKVQKMT